MGNLKEIKQKMKGISTTQQITGAMKLMSTAKLGRLMEKIELSKSYVSKLEQIVHSIANELPANFSHPCITGRPVNNSGFIIISGERGLCGGFNHDLNKFAMASVQEHQSTTKKLILMGKKSLSMFRRSGIEITAEYPDIVGHHEGTQLFEISARLFEMFKKGEIDDLSLIYTSFVSPVKRYLTQIKMLPLDKDAFGEIKDKKKSFGFDFYPSPEGIFNNIIPRYIRNILYRAIIESSASEQSARMAAMTSATDRAEEMMDDLKLDFNRTRQSIITREISEVIAGIDG
jgi:F-type H+-transporting ATPase subunit gamma